MNWFWCKDTEKFKKIFQNTYHSCYYCTSWNVQNRYFCLFPWV